MSTVPKVTVTRSPDEPKAAVHTALTNGEHMDAGRRITYRLATGSGELVFDPQTPAS